MEMLLGTSKMNNAAHNDCLQRAELLEKQILSDSELSVVDGFCFAHLICISGTYRRATCALKGPREEI